MKKTFVKILSVILTLSFVSVFSGVVAYAQLGSATAEVPLLQEGSFDDEILEAQELQLSSPTGIMALALDEPDVEEYLYQAMLNYDDTVNIVSYSVSVSDFPALYTKVVNDHQDLFYVSSSIYYRYTSGGYIYDVTPEYVLTEEEHSAAMQVFNSGVNRALSYVDDTMTDLQKALVLHDYLCDICLYAPDSSTNDLPDYHSAYGVFNNGITVCAGYALAYSYLLNALDIPCQYVVSSTMAHAWNLVKIDGLWYNVDLTFDDAKIYSNDVNISGSFMHRCFMKSNTSFEGEMGYYHYGGKVSDDELKGCTPPANDTTYDDYFWNSINTNICVINGDYYYLAGNGSATHYLSKRDAQGEVTQLSTTSVVSNVITYSSERYDADNVAHTITSKDYYSRLVYLDNKFFVNSGKIIYVYYPKNNTYIKSAIMSDASSNIIGLGTDGDEIVYNQRNSVQPITLDKNLYFKANLSRKNSTVYNNYVDFNNDGYVNGKDFAMLNYFRKHMQQF